MCADEGCQVSGATMESCKRTVVDPEEQACIQRNGTKIGDGSGGRQEDR